ncbi:MAG TPA: DUF998 domain-containing protein [Ktedonobacterales bacterium]|nr:DUF998 domain-containing protein [Ktedonobacterales bacterium]
MSMTSRQATHFSLGARLLLACGAIGPIVFIVAFLIEGATRPGYSAWHNFVSDLSESNLGWMQIASFLFCGAMVFGFAIGLRQVFRSGRGATWGPLLLGAFGLSLIVAGVFVTDPSLGYYPLGSPAGAQTLHGTIHGTIAPVVFGLLTAATFVFARRFARDPLWRGWGVYSLVTGIVCVVTFIACLATAVLDEHGVLPNSPTGLLERVAIIVGWGWIALLAIRLLRQVRSSPMAKA